MEGCSKWRFKLSKTSAMKNSFLRNNEKVITDISMENTVIFGDGRRVKETIIPYIFFKLAFYIKHIITRNLVNKVNIYFNDKELTYKTSSLDALDLSDINYIYNGVVDTNYRNHDIDNLYIIGPSILPKPTSSNPRLYILMFSMRISDQMAGLFGN